MLITLSGIVIEVKEEQPSKASTPILVIELEIVILVRPSHHLNALSPILAIPFPIVMAVRVEHLSKA